VRYDYEALKRLKKYRPKIEKDLQHMQVVLSFHHLMFEPAEKTFEEELRLRTKIDKFYAERQDEIKRVQKEVAVLKEDELQEIGLCHPRNQVGENGRLTERGIKVCEALFERSLSPLAVSYLMRLSYRATSRRYKVWRGWGPLTEATGFSSPCPGALSEPVERPNPRDDALRFRVRSSVPACR